MSYGKAVKQTGRCHWSVSINSKKKKRPKCPISEHMFYYKLSVRTKAFCHMGSQWERLWMVKDNL